MSAERYHLDPEGFRSHGERPSKVYAYLDREGRPAGAVARFEPRTSEEKKRFLQFRAQGDGHVLGLDGQALPLYRLPDLIAAIARGEEVDVAEGEKCVDRLAEAGRTATTNPGGAGKWRAEYAEFFGGARVVIHADSDAIGRSHAQEIAASLQGVASSLKVVELPSKEEGDDVFDWFARGGTAELLKEIVTSAPHWTPPRIEVSELWPDPIPFSGAVEPEPFPLDRALPGDLAVLSRAIADVVRMDVTAPAVLIPTVISASAGNAFEIQVSKQHIESNLSRYAALIFDPGERKTKLFRLVADPLLRWAEEESPKYERAKRVYLDAIELDRRRREKAIKDQVSKSGKGVFVLPDELPRPPRIPIGVLSDITAPELVRRMHGNGGAVPILSGDSRHVVDSILGQHRADGQLDDTVYLRAHGGDPIDRARVGTGGLSELITIPRPALAVGLVIQPDKINQLIQRAEAKTSGLLARFNFSSPYSFVGERFETGDEEPLSVELAVAYEAAIYRILDERFRIVDADPGRITPVTLTLDGEAMALRRAYFNELEAKLRRGHPLRAVSAFVSKCAGEAGRLAGLFHLYLAARAQALDRVGEVPISAAIWRMAECHQRWQFDETMRVLSLAQESPADKSARRVLEWVGETFRPDHPVTARDATTAKRVEDTAEFDAAMARLEEKGWARQVPAQGKERSARWIFHPKAFGGGS